jgi:hypothetical protein
MGLRRGCGPWGQQHGLLDFELPPPPLTSSRDVHRNDAGPSGQWPCAVDVMAWMNIPHQEVHRWDPPSG